jgi:hypothetical protein
LAVLRCIRTQQQAGTPTGLAIQRWGSADLLYAFYQVIGSGPVTIIAPKLESKQDLDVTQKVRFSVLLNGLLIR